MNYNRFELLFAFDFAVTDFTWVDKLFFAREKVLAVIQFRSSGKLSWANGLFGRSHIDLAATKGRRDAGIDFALNRL